MDRIMELFKQIEASKDLGGSISHIIVGLGNPGKEYAETRHNVGFRFLDALSEKYGVRTDWAKFHALISDTVIAGRRVLLMKPQTFMNSSGFSVREAADFYKIAPENILVVYDDITLVPGRIRVRRKGSDGGHNGIKSIIMHLGSDAFPRVRIGIGEKPHKDYDLADWVLGVPPLEAREKIAKTFPTVIEHLPLMLSDAEGDFEKAVQRCNGFQA